MRILTPLGIVATLVLGACAASPAEIEERDGYVLTPKAEDLVREQGKATAAARGMSESSELVCETRKKLGSHMVEKFCYTRTEAAQKRRRAKDAIRDVKTGGTRVDQ